MEDGHIICGRPWQYDHKCIHDGYTDKIFFTHQGSQIIIISLTPRVTKDEIKLKVKIEKEKYEGNMEEESKV